MESVSDKSQNLKLSLVYSGNTSSETIFITRIQIKDNVFQGIWLTGYMVGLKPDSVRPPFCHVESREFKSRTSRHQTSRSGVSSTPDFFATPRLKAESGQRSNAVASACLPSSVLVVVGRHARDPASLGLDGYLEDVHQHEGAVRLAEEAGER